MSIETSLNAICGTALDAVVAVDQEGRIVGFNAEAERLFGRTRGDVIGAPMAETIVPDRYRAAHHAGMQRFLDTGERKLIGGKVEIEALHAEGHDVPVELGLSLLQIDGETVFLSFLRDLTERRARERDIREARDRAERANAAKSFVVSMVAHDMRNALGGVTGSLALLDRARLTPEEREIVDGIDEAAYSLKRLLSDTLDIARLEAGEIEVSPAPLDIAEFLAELRHAWEGRLAKAGIDLTVDVAQGAPGRVMLDGHRLRQIVANLISNAVKYAPGAPVSLTITADGTDGLCIAVADSGPGFTDDALATAFEPFVRPEGQAAKGAGLGLAIVKTITEAMGGSLAVQSAPGEGARITIRFKDCCLPDAAPAPQAPVDHGHLAVLLVEDNATNRLVAAKMLEKIGCDVTLCEDGENGAETAERIGFDAIFMDIDLPKLNGKDAIRRIRAGDGPNAAAPIVAFTAFAIRSQREEILASGADTILTKPVSGPEDFSRALDSVVERRPAALPPPKPANAQGIDRERLAALHETLGAEDFAMLSVEFRRDLEGILADVTAPQATGEALRKATHVAISLTGTLGAGKAQDAAERLNTAIHTLGAEEIEARRLEFETALREAMTALDTWQEAS